MKYVYPVLVGLMATTAAGLLLMPVGALLSAVLESLNLFDVMFGHMSFGLLIVSIFVLWFLLSSVCGGFASVLFIEEKEDFVIFLLIVVSTTICLLVLQLELFLPVLKFELLSPWTLIMFLSFVTGYILGGLIGIRRKRKKLKSNPQ